MNNNKIISTIWALLFMCLAQPVLAAETGIEHLNHFVNKVMTFQARFIQTVVAENGDVVEEAQGLFILNRPGQFRWDYQQPYPQYIVADGERIWFYDVDLEQVTVKSQQDILADTPATLLSGNKKPEDSYVLTNLASDDALQWVQLIPKDEESSFQSITLAFTSYGLNQMVMRDNFGQKTRIVFSQTKENPELADDVFVFTPPSGVDVIGDSGL